MNIGFDLDGVLYDWHDVVYNHCVNGRGYSDSFSQFWIDYRDYPKDVQDNFESTSIFFSKKIPSKCLMSFLGRIAKDNTIFYITARRDEVKSATAGYLERYRFPDSDNLIFTKDKATYIKLLDIDIFVDDFPRTLDRIGNSAKTFLVRRPWNNDISHKYNCVDSVLDIENELYSG